MQSDVNKEKVLWVIRTTNKLSLLKSVVCNVVFKVEHLVLANLTPEFQKSESKRVAAEIKENKVGFLKASAAMMDFWATYNKKYYTMDTEIILSEDPINLKIYYSDISEVDFKSAKRKIGDDDEPDRVAGGKLEFSLNNGKVVKLTHSIEDTQATKQFLSDIFGNKLKYK
ncbi:MAG: hypothetical protein RBR71_04970 [Gudongella sp.]|nr:hypothetical protein [Gudongella sp.]